MTQVRNCEGYIDIVPYEAIKNVRRHIMEEKFTRGDIFTFEAGKMLVRGIVVQSFERYVTFLALTTKRTEDNSFAIVNERAQSEWVDLGKVRFIYKSNIIRKVGHIATGSEERLTKAIAQCLNLGTVTVDTKPVEEAIKFAIYDKDEDVTCNVTMTRQQAKAIEWFIEWADLDCEVTEAKTIDNFNLA